MKITRLILLAALALSSLAPLLAANEPAGPADAADLRVTKSKGGALLLAWKDAGSELSSDPTIFEGSLDELRRGEWKLEPVDCSTEGDHREEILPTPGSRYYLLVPRPERRHFDLKRGTRKIPHRSKPTPCSLKR